MASASGNHPAAPEAPEGWQQALALGISHLAELPARRLGPQSTEKAEILLALCHLLLFRLQTRSDLPFVGIVGNADSGKSTLFNSVAGSEISLVTPIPHQTLGPILAVPGGFEPAASHPSLLRPVAGRLEWVPANSSGVTGSPDAAVCVPVWRDGEKAFVLLDLPDVGTVDSRQEHQVALRLLPWLDRIVLLVTEESFAQADHQDISRRLQALRPERARADLFVVLNRRHDATQDNAFLSRLETLRELWPQATVTWLPHLPEGRRFSAVDYAPILAEVSGRGSQALRTAIRNLGQELSREIRDLSDVRQREQRLLRETVCQEIAASARFQRTFLSDDFRRRLDAFSPWHTSLRRLRALLGQDVAREPAALDILAGAPVERYLLQSAQRLRDTLGQRLTRLTALLPQDGAPGLPDLDAQAIRASTAALVAESNARARRNVESLLASLQERHRLKDPGWGLLTLVSSSVLLLDLFIPGVGTIGSVGMAALLSALGVGGIFTADYLRKLRSSQVREGFEAGMRSILEQAVAPLLDAGPSAAFLDLAGVSERLRRWTQELPEV